MRAGYYPSFPVSAGTDSDIKEKNGENAKNVTSMPASLDLAFMEMISGVQL